MPKSRHSLNLTALPACRHPRHVALCYTYAALPTPQTHQFYIQSVREINDGIMLVGLGGGGSSPGSSPPWWAQAGRARARASVLFFIAQVFPILARGQVRFGDRERSEGKKKKVEVFRRRVFKVEHGSYPQSYFSCPAMPVLASLSRVPVVDVALILATRRPAVAEAVVRTRRTPCCRPPLPVPPRAALSLRITAHRGASLPFVAR